MINPPFNTVFVKDDCLHLAELNPLKKDVLFSIEIVRYSKAEDINQLMVCFWPKDLKVPFFQFNFSDEVRDIRNTTRAIFTIPIEKISMNPPFLISISSDDDLVDLKEWKFMISWE